MQDQVKEILESLHAEWELGELYAWQTGLDLMIQGRKEGKPYTIEITIGDWHGTDVDEYLRQERGSWVSPTYVEVMDQALLLSDEDLARLRRELDEYIRQEEEKWASCPHLLAKEDAEPLLDVREFRGIGHGTWTDVGGVDEFIKQERASWDDPGRAVSELQAQNGHSITELRGVGKEFWQGIEVEEYIRQERGLWDENTPPRHKAKDFRGIGKETWKDVHVEEFIKQERASWDA